MTAPLSQESLKRWLQVYIATILGEPSETIATNEALSTFDLDSIDSVTMAIELEKRFAIQVLPEIFLSRELSLDDIVKQLRP